MGYLSVNGSNSNDLFRGKAMVKPDSRCPVCGEGIMKLVIDTSARMQTGFSLSVNVHTSQFAERFEDLANGRRCASHPLTVILRVVEKIIKFFAPWSTSSMINPPILNPHRSCSWRRSIGDQTSNRVSHEQAS
jgi:hypothetical protein